MNRTVLSKQITKTDNNGKTITGIQYTSYKGMFIKKKVSRWVEWNG